MWLIITHIGIDVSLGVDDIPLKGAGGYRALFVFQQPKLHMRFKRNVYPHGMLARTAFGNERRKIGYGFRARFAGYGFAYLLAVFVIAYRGLRDPKTALVLIDGAFVVCSL